MALLTPTFQDALTAGSLRALLTSQSPSWAIEAASGSVVFANVAAATAFGYRSLFDLMADPLVGLAGERSANGYSSRSLRNGVAQLRVYRGLKAITVRAEVEEIELHGGQRVFLLTTQAGTLKNAVTAAQLIAAFDGHLDFAHMDADGNRADFGLQPVGEAWSIPIETGDVLLLPKVLAPTALPSEPAADGSKESLTEESSTEPVEHGGDILPATLDGPALNSASADNASADMAVVSAPELADGLQPDPAQRTDAAKRDDLIEIANPRDESASRDATDLTVDTPASSDHDIVITQTDGQNMAPFDFERRQIPDRFVWQSDNEAVIVSTSQELAEAVGGGPAHLVGRSIVEIVDAYGGNAALVQDAIHTGRAFSGIELNWPVQGAPLIVPVTLAGTPLVTRSGEVSYRGFGLCRTLDAFDPAGDLKESNATKQPLSNFGKAGIAAPRRDNRQMLENRPSPPDKAPQSASLNGPITEPTTASLATVGDSASDQTALNGADVPGLADAATNGEAPATAPPAPSDTVAVIEVAGGSKAPSSDQEDRDKEIDPASTQQPSEDGAQSPQSAPQSAQENASESSTSFSGFFSAASVLASAAVARITGSRNDKESPTEIADAENSEAAEPASPSAPVTSLAFTEPDGRGDAGNDVAPRNTEHVNTGHVKTGHVNTGHSDEAGSDIADMDAAYIDGGYNETPADDPASDPEKWAEDEWAEIQNWSIPANDDLENGSQGTEGISRSHLTKPEEDAFRQIAKELGARFEGDIEKPLPPQSHLHLADDGQFDFIEPPLPVPNAAAPAVKSEASTAISLRPSAVHRLIDKLPIGVLISQADDILMVNSAFLSLTGYRSLDELKAKSGLSELFAEPDALDPAIAALRARAGIDDRLLRVVRADQVEIPVDVQLNTIPWAGSVTDETSALDPKTTDDAAAETAAPGAPALMMSFSPKAGGASALVPSGESRSSDWTALEQAAPGRLPALERDHDHGAMTADLHARLAELDAVLNIAADGVLMLDEAGVIQSTNKAAEALLGAEAAKLIDRPISDFVDLRSRADLATYLKAQTADPASTPVSDGLEITLLPQLEGVSSQFSGRVSGRVALVYLTLGRINRGASAKLCAVLRDMTQWKATERDLQNARLSAESASAQKSEFLSRISHEIRTPLNAIIGFSEVLLDERLAALSAERRREYLHDIHQSGSHIMSLVDDLLDLARIEAGRMTVTFRNLNVAALIKQCVAMVQAQAIRDKIILRTFVPDGLPSIIADERNVKQILVNLLSNAVKFNLPGGQVIVSAVLEDNGDFVLRVKDTGVGIAADDIPLAMEPFRRLKSSANSTGSGLGLPLTKALADVNRATFHLASEVNQGTVAEVRFPKARVVHS